MATPGPVGVAQPSSFTHETAQVSRDSRKRTIDAEENTDHKHSTKRERHDSGDEGSTTASNDENHSSNSDSDTASREHFDDDAASLASIMLSIAQSCGKRPSKSQPSSASRADTCVNMSATSSTAGDDNDDENSGDSTQIKKQRRREKNRASAQQSRQRKKYHLETLEVRVEELERDRATLMSRVEALAAENRRLRALAPGGAAEVDVSNKADEIAGAGLLNQLAQAAQKLSALSQ